MGDAKEMYKEESKYYILCQSSPQLLSAWALSLLLQPDPVCEPGEHGRVDGEGDHRVQHPAELHHRQGDI